MFRNFIRIRIQCLLPTPLVIPIIAPLASYHCHLFLSPPPLSLLLHLIVTLFPTTIDPLTSSPAMGEGYGASTCTRKTFSGHENESNTPMLHLPFWRRLLVPLLLWGVRRQASCNASDVPCLDPMHCNGGIDILLVQYQSCPTYTLHPPYSRF